MEKEEEGSTWASVATGVVIGLAVGGIMGLLLAPKPGAELREDLKDKTEETLDRLQEATSELMTRTRDLVDQTRDNLTQSVEAGKAAFQEKRSELTSQLES